MQELFLIVISATLGNYTEVSVYILYGYRNFYILNYFEVESEGIFDNSFCGIYDM